ncbi:DUF2474 family protein [Vibrio marisflavi]
MRQLTKQFLWFLLIWTASVSALSLFAYLLRFVIG